jgi:hypothetical protein
VFSRKCVPFEIPEEIPEERAPGRRLLPPSQNPLQLPEKKISTCEKTKSQNPFAMPLFIKDTSIVY